MKKYDSALEVADMVSDAYDSLEKIYNSGVDLNKKMKQRDKVFKKIRDKGYELNNASLWDMRVYTKNFRILTEVYDKAGTVKGFVELMRDCPSTEPEALKYITDYLKR